MKKILFLVCLVFSLSVRADIATDSVVLRTMDKITGRVQKITVPVGEQTKVNTLSVLVAKCLKRPPEETPENAAFLTVTDEDKPERPLFQGWMFSSNPALSAMEHPVYDIWVVECGITAPKEQILVENEPIIEEADPNEIIED